MANNLIPVTSTNPTRGAYLLSLHEFYYLKERPNGLVKVVSPSTTAIDTVQEDIDTLLPFGGDDLVEFTDIAGAKIACNRIFVKRVLLNIDLTATVVFDDETSMRTQEAYSVLRPYFLLVSSGSGGPVLVDGVTIVGNGTTVQLEVGLISTDNIPDNEITFQQFQQIASQRILGRYSPSTGEVEELTLGTTLTLSVGGELGVNVGNIVVSTDGSVIIGDGTTGNVIRLADGSLATVKFQDNAVTFAKMQQVSSSVLIGRYDSGTGNLQTITIGAGLSLSVGGELTRDGDAVTAVENGLTLSATTIKLGGTLTEDTTIDGDSTYNLTVQDVVALDLMAATADLGATGQVGITAGEDVVIQATENVTLDAVDFVVTVTDELTLNATGDVSVSGASVQVASTDDIDFTSTSGDVNLNADQVKLGNDDGEVWIATRYAFPADAPSIPSDGDIQIQQWRNDGGTITPEWVAKPSSAAGGGLWYEVTPPANFTKILVFASGSGVTFSQISSNEWGFTVPDGVDLYGGGVFADTAANPGGTLYVRWTFSGNAADGNARKVNTSLATLKPPLASVINASFAATGPTRSDAFPVRRLSGSSLLEENVTAVPGVASATYLEMQYVNYNSNFAGGNNQTLYTFNF